MIISKQFFHWLMKLFDFTLRVINSLKAVAMHYIFQFSIDDELENHSTMLNINMYLLDLQYQLISIQVVISKRQSKPENLMSLVLMEDY